MIKCQQCRERDVELLSKWERFKNSLFYKVNNTFFSDDLDDLKSQKYTQGFSDGITNGVESERHRNQIESLLYNIDKPKPTEDEIEKAVNKLLSNVDTNKIVAFNQQTKQYYIGGELADDGRLSNLRAEAEFLLNTDLWSVLYETPKELAQRAMFVSSESLDDMKKGKSMLYTLDTQKNIIDKFKNYISKK